MRASLQPGGSHQGKQCQDSLVTSSRKRLLPLLALGGFLGRRCGSGGLLGLRGLLFGGLLAAIVTEDFGPVFPELGTGARANDGTTHNAFPSKNF